MDRDIRRSTLPTHRATAEARGIFLRPSRYERDARPGCDAAVQDLPALPRPAVEMGGHAGSVAQDPGYHGSLDE